MPKPPSSHLEMNQSVQLVQANKEIWANLEIDKKIIILKDIHKKIADYAEDWISADLSARSIPKNNWDNQTSISTGPLFALRLSRLYLETLENIRKYDKKYPRPIKNLPNGQSSVSVFPGEICDRFIFRGFSAEIWQAPSLHPQDFAMLNDKDSSPKISKVALILGAGNVSGIVFADLLYKLFIENHVVVVKLHPVCDYMGVILDGTCQSLIEQGFLQIVYGGASEGDYLCCHSGIDEIHVTGSAATFENIVFGSTLNKQLSRPRMAKRVTGELGNVGPVIVIPGPYSQNDLLYQAENIASGLMINNGYNCTAHRLIIQHAQGSQRETLLDQLRSFFSRFESQTAYYPGSHQTFQEIVKVYPQAELFGQFSSTKIPWTLVSHLNPHQKEIFFDKELFGPFLGETALDANSIPNFIDEAVRFCNETLWGTLCATLVVHPKSMQEPYVKEAIERAIENLRYGSICINHYPGLLFFLGVSCWGAYPGASYQDIQSGIGQVHNVYMLENSQKTVFQGPFKVWPKPAWFASNKNGYKIAQKYLDFEKSRSVSSFLKLLRQSLR